MKWAENESWYIVQVDHCLWYLKIVLIIHLGIILKIQSHDASESLIKNPHFDWFLLKYLFSEDIYLYTYLAIFSAALCIIYMVVYVLVIKCDRNSCCKLFQISVLFFKHDYVFNQNIKYNVSNYYLNFCRLKRLLVNTGLFVWQEQDLIPKNLYMNLMF